MQSLRDRQVGRGRVRGGEDLCLNELYREQKEAVSHNKSRNKKQEKGEGSGLRSEPEKAHFLTLLANARVQLLSCIV